MGIFDIFGNKENGTETSETANDMERWCTDTYALWAESTGGSWKRIGGYKKSRADASMMRGVLRRDWDIHNGQELLETIVGLLRVKDHNEKESDAWDYCRATQLAGIGYITGYFTREIFLNCSAVAAKVMQQTYNSWEELCESYLAGYAQWRQDEELVKRRREIYKKLCDMPDGPYRIPWDFNMDEWLKGAEVVYDIVMN